MYYVDGRELSLDHAEEEHWHQRKCQKIGIKEEEYDLLEDIQELVSSGLAYSSVYIEILSQ